MNCKWVGKNLSEFLDGQIGPPRAERIEAHLAACPECRLQKEELQATLRLVSQVGRLSCPTDCREPVLRRIAARSPVALRVPFSLWPTTFHRGLTALAATGVVCLGLFVGIRLTPAQGPGIDPPTATVMSRTDLTEWHDVNASTLALGANDALALAAPGPSTPSGPERR